MKEQTFIGGFFMEIDTQTNRGSEYSYVIYHQSESDEICERNKQQALRFFMHDFSIYEEIVAEDIRIHGPATGQETIGIKAAKVLDTGYAAAYPNAQYTIHDLFAASDKVVVRWSVQATHTGERRGLKISRGTQDLPPTNQEIILNGIHVYRFNQEGKIIDSWAMWDRLGEIEQIADLTITAKTKKRAFPNP
jgi:predicted ester cyclase